MKQALVVSLIVATTSCACAGGWFSGDGVNVGTVKVSSVNTILLGSPPYSMGAWASNVVGLVISNDVLYKTAVTNNQPQAYIGSWNINSASYDAELRPASGKYGAIYDGSGYLSLYINPNGSGTFNAPPKGMGYGVTVGGWDQNGIYAQEWLGGFAYRTVYLLPALDAITNALVAATNAAVIDATNRVAGVGYLLPDAIQNLATVSQLSVATNAAIVDATNRVAGVGYLLPVSTQNLATVSQLTSHTNRTDNPHVVTATQVGAVPTNDTRYLTSLTNAWQNPASATNWTWTSDGAAITLTGYTGPNAVVIPDMLDGLPVTGFGTIFSPGYAGSAITSISGSANVTTIVAYAFYSCDALTSVILPNATVIGYQSFFGCTALTSVSLPSATVIGNQSFSGCTALTTVSLPSATTIVNGAFYGCTALTSVSLPNATVIGNSAFYGCTALTSVSLPSATTIVAYAFYSCDALTSVILPNATAIGSESFYSCDALTSVRFGQNAPAEAADVYSFTPNVTNYVTNPQATGWGSTWNGQPVVRLPVYADNFYGSGTGLTGITAAQVGAVTPGEATNIVIAVGTAQGWSTNTSWTWQGAQIVAVDTSAYAIAYGGPAIWNAGSNRFDVLPYSTTNYGAITGTVTITMASNAYLSSVGGTWYIKTVSGTGVQQPVLNSLVYSTSTSAVLSAWCSTNPADATSDYYAYFSNLVVYTYDRPSMTPYHYTNDAAGIVARVDPLPTGNTDTRRVVNSESLSAAIAAAKPDIAVEAWRYMPSGARQPTYNAVTIDKPLILQSGGVTFMQSGDYFAQSYAGTWDSSVTGSTWAIGPSGTKALQIDSTNINLAITSFTVRTNVATFVIATNWVQGTPYIEQCADLMAPQWLYVTGQTITNKTTNWTATCSTVATMRFFRAVSPGGANKITSAYQHQFGSSWRLTDTAWDDLRISAALRSVGANQPSLDAFQGGVRLWMFQPSDELYFTAQLPHGYKPGTTLKPHVHWTHAVGSPSGDVAWMLEYTTAPYGSGSYAAPTTIGATTTVSSVSQYGQGFMALPSISGSGLAESSCIVGRLYRNSDAGSDVMLVEFDIHHEVEKPGTDNETP